MNKLLYNPFETINDKKLLYIGIAGTFVASLLAWLLNCRFGAYITLTPLLDVTIYQPLLDNIVGIIVTAVVLYITGISINRKTRFVDILNTATIARLPFYINMVPNINNYMAIQTNALMAAQQNPESMETSGLGAITVIAFVGLLFLVWMIALLYNGFRVATNTKKVVHIILFAVAVLSAHFASGYVIYALSY